jgi:acylphosphatase/uncharacterized protein YoxC
MKEDVQGIVRRRFIVKGRVQKVNYRDEVQAIARTLGVTGYVKNLRSGDVEVVCEGAEAAIAKFEKELAIKKGLIDVRDVVADETLPIKGKFAYFDIKYGPMEEELGERMSTGFVYIREVGDKVAGVGKAVEAVGKDVQGVGQKIDCMGQKIDGLGQKMDGVGKDVQGVGTAVRDMHASVDKRFDHMAEHYDMIAISLKEAIAHMDRNAEKTDRAIEKSRKDTIIAVRKSEERTARILRESRKEVAASNRELAGAVKFMIRKLSDKPARKRPAGKRKR